VEFESLFALADYATLAPMLHEKSDKERVDTLDPKGRSNAVLGQKMTGMSKKSVLWRKKEWP